MSVGKTSRRRLRRKRLRPLERLLADICRLYLARPRGGVNEAVLENLSRSLVELNLSLLMEEWRRVSPGHLRPYRMQEVHIRTMVEGPNSLQASGTVQWSRRSKGQELTREDSFRLKCSVPSRHRTDRRLRPVVLLGESADRPGLTTG